MSEQWTCNTCGQANPITRQSCANPTCQAPKTAWTVQMEQVRLLKIPRKGFQCMTGMHEQSDEERETWARVPLAEVERALAFVREEDPGGADGEWDEDDEEAWKDYIQTTTPGFPDAEKRIFFSERLKVISPSPKGLEMLYRGVLMQRQRDVEEESATHWADPEFPALANAERCDGGLIPELQASGYDAANWEKTKTVRALHKRHALDLIAHDCYPATRDLLLVRVRTKGDPEDLILTPHPEGSQREEDLEFPQDENEVTSQGFYDVRFLLVYGRKEDAEEIPDDAFPGVEVVDVSDDTSLGHAPKLSVQALARKKPQTLSVVSAGPPVVHAFSVEPREQAPPAGMRPRIVMLPLESAAVLRWEVEDADFVRIFELDLGGTARKIAHIATGSREPVTGEFEVTPTNSGVTYTLFASSKDPDTEQVISQRCRRDVQAIVLAKAAAAGTWHFNGETARWSGPFVASGQFIELRNELDLPVPEAAFVLELPGGRRISGKLGKDGRYQIPGGPPGELRLRYTDPDDVLAKAEAGTVRWAIERRDLDELVDVFKAYTLLTPRIQGAYDTYFNTLGGKGLVADLREAFPQPAARALLHGLLLRGGVEVPGVKRVAKPMALTRLGGETS